MDYSGAFYSKGFAMLVFTRKTWQTIRIGDNITITVVKSDRDRLKLGVDAPANVPVHRGEIYDKLHRQGTDDETEGQAS